MYASTIRIPLVLSAALALFSSTWAAPAAHAQGKIQAYSPGQGKPGDRIKILGKNLPEQGTKQVRYGRGNSPLGIISNVRGWTGTTIRVVLPGNMPTGTYWFGIYNKSGKLKLRGPETFQLQGSQPPPKPPAVMDTRDQGTVEGLRPKPVTGKLLESARLIPDLAITGFSGYPVATIGETVTVTANVTNHNAGTSGLPYYVFRRDQNGKVVASKMFKLPKKGQLLKIPLTIYIDPKKVSGQGSTLTFRDQIWVGGSQDTQPGSFKDANNSNNQFQFTMWAKRL